MLNKLKTQTEPLPKNILCSPSLLNKIITHEISFGFFLDKV